MKKILLSITAIAALGLASVNDASAQVISGFYKQSYKERNNGTFDKGTSLFSVGIGVPYAYGGYSSTLPPVYAKYEMGVTDEIGVGLVGGLGLGKNSFTKDTYFATSIGAAGYYHFNKFIPVKKLDVYAGLGLAVSINNRFGSSNVNAQFLFPIGARYYFSKGFGVYLESGVDYLSFTNLGITLRF